ncbi:MAG: hypothetical protein QM760_00350 [Nibricoccus sp.]
MRTLSLKSKMLLGIGTVVVFGLALTIGFIAWRNETLARQQGIAYARELSSARALEVSRILERAFAVPRTLAHSLEGTQASEHALSREAIQRMLRSTLESNPAIFALWTCWEPNALDNRDADFVGRPGHDATGRFVPYFYQQEKGIGLEALNDYATPGAGDYYLLARDSNRETVLEPYPYEVGGKKILMTSLVVPVHVGDKVVGAVGVDLDLIHLAKLTASKIFDEGYTTLISQKGTYVSHPDAARLNQPVIKTDPWLEPLLAGIAKGEGFSLTSFSPRIQRNRLSHRRPDLHRRKPGAVERHRQHP